MITEVQVILGGVLLGIAAGIMLLIQGKILGCSGMLFRSLDLAAYRHNVDGMLFLLGLFISGLIFNSVQNVPNPTSIFKTDTWLIILGGILVGAGAYLGNGCTSGHGLCGISLMRKRSIVAVCIFFPVAIITSWLIH